MQNITVKQYMMDLACVWGEISSFVPDTSCILCEILKIAQLVTTVQ